jgi:diguanylate cyclase (GGDEF)-like protein/PAS domain S-box-containing protein
MADGPGDTRLDRYDPDVWALVEASPDPMVVIQDGRHVFANARALALYRARDLAELASQPAIDYMAPDLRGTGVLRLRSMAEDRRQLDYVEEAIVRRDGTRCETEAAGAPIMFGGRPAALVVMRDITARIAAEAARTEAEKRFRSAFVHAPIGMAVLDPEGRITDANPALAELLRCTPADLVGTPVWHWLQPNERPASHARFARLLAGQSSVETAEFELLRADGSPAWGRASTSALSDKDGRSVSFVLQLEDITAQKSAEDQLRHQATRDQLTGLANRALFTARLTDALTGAGTARERPAVLFLDLDRFKIINDSMGHGCGDELLIQVAERLRHSVRPGDTVARLGGDEFAVLLPAVRTVDDAGWAAKRLLRSFGGPFVLAGQDVFVKASLGIALAEPGTDAATILRDADAAMYRAKADGRGRFAAFDETMRTECNRRMDLETGLFGALNANEFDLVYQPIVDTAHGRLVAVEALLRWRRSSGELVGPDEFIPIAEETGLIVPIGAWVVRQAAAQLRRWRAAQPACGPMTVAVNVSIRQLATADFADLVIRLANEIHPDRLSVEITESATAQISEPMIRVLERVRAHGVTIAVDDFGTGHSSLARLRSLPVDLLKIDRQFTAAAATSTRDESVVVAIVAMAQALGLTTLAEGVETDDQAGLLRRAGCPLLQGYLYGRPQPAEQIIWPDAIEDTEIRPIADARRSFG